MSLQSYTKPPKTPEEQVSLLIKRGMLIDDRDFAVNEISRLNYYRLRGYWITFEKAGDIDHTFKEGTRFEDVLSLYRFDEDLRSLLLYYLGMVEVFLRFKFSFFLDLEFQNPLIYRNEEIFDCKSRKSENWNHKDSLEKLDHYTATNQKLLAEELKEEYWQPSIWAVVEIMSFGQLVRWCRNLRHKQVVKGLVNSFGMRNKREFRSFLQSAAALRNICARQNRLVYRSLSLPPASPSTDSDLHLSWNPESNKLYNFLTLLVHVMPNIDPTCSLKDDIQELAMEHGVFLQVIGFPKDWADRPVWV